MSHERSSIRDVARLAGVSRQTVSRVVNAPDSVAALTRQRVAQAIRALDYRPNPSARGLRSTHSRTIGVMANAESWFGRFGVPTIALSAQLRSYQLLLSPVFGDSFDSARQAASLLLDQRVEGLLVMAPESFTAEYAASLADQVPVVFVQDAALKPDHSYVGIDTEAGVGQVVEHLVARGHRDLAHISGPLTWGSARARAAAWRRELEVRDLRVRVPVEGNYRCEGGYAAGQRMIERGLPDAVFAANDLTATGFIRAMADHGVRVPDDVSVVGYDDHIDSAYLVPRLTTVRAPFDEVCDKAMQVVVDMIGGAGVRHEVLTPQLIVRESVADRSLG